MSSVNKRSDLIFESPKTLTHQLKHLGLSDKKWVQIAKLFENNPSNFALEDGNIVTLDDKKIVFRKEELTKKPVYGKSIIAFFLKGLKGKKYHQRMNRLAIGLLDLMKKTQNSPLSQSDYKIEKIDIKDAKQTSLPEQVEHQESKPFVFIEDGKNENQKISELTSEKDSSLASQMPEIKDVKSSIDKLKDQKNVAVTADKKNKKIKAQEKENARAKLAAEKAAQEKKLAAEKAEQIKAQKLAAEKAAQEEENARVKLVAQGKALIASKSSEIKEAECLMNETDKLKYHTSFNNLKFLYCKNDIDAANRALEKLQNNINGFGNIGFSFVDPKKELESAIKEFNESVSKISQVKIEINQINQKVAAANADEENKKIQVQQEAIQTAQKELQKERNALITLVDNLVADAALLVPKKAEIEKLEKLITQADASGYSFLRGPFVLIKKRIELASNNLETLKRRIKDPNQETSSSQIRSDKSELVLLNKEFKDIADLFTQLKTTTDSTISQIAILKGKK